MGERHDVYVPVVCIVFVVFPDISGCFFEFEEAINSGTEVDHCADK